jgi:hypothetical protein
MNLCQRQNSQSGIEVRPSVQLIQYMITVDCIFRQFMVVHGLLPRLYHLVHLWTRPEGQELVLRVTAEQMQDAAAPPAKEH